MNIEELVNLIHYLDKRVDKAEGVAEIKAYRDMGYITDKTGIELVLHYYG